LNLSKTRVYLRAKSQTKRKIMVQLSTKTLLVALLLIVLGFILMAAGEVNPENIFSTRRISVAPVVLLTGYTLVIFAIMSNKKNKEIENS